MYHGEINYVRLAEDKSGAILAFSMYTNSVKLFSCRRSRNPDVMECLNGIRALSALWVLYAHSHVLLLATPALNIAYLPEVRSNSPQQRSTLIFLSIAAVLPRMVLSSGAKRTVFSGYLPLHQWTSLDLVSTADVHDTVSNGSQISFVSLESSFSHSAEREE